MGILTDTNIKVQNNNNTSLEDNADIVDINEINELIVSLEDADKAITELNNLAEKKELTDDDIPAIEGIVSKVEYDIPDYTKPANEVLTTAVTVITIAALAGLYLLVNKIIKYFKNKIKRSKRKLKSITKRNNFEEGYFKDGVTFEELKHISETKITVRVNLPKLPTAKEVSLVYAFSSIKSTRAYINNIIYDIIGHTNKIILKFVDDLKVVKYYEGLFAKINNGLDYKLYEDEIKEFIESLDYIEEFKGLNETISTYITVSNSLNGKTDGNVEILTPLSGKVEVVNLPALGDRETIKELSVEPIIDNYIVTDVQDFASKEFVDIEKDLANYESSLEKALKLMNDLQKLSKQAKVEYDKYLKSLDKNIGHEGIKRHREIVVDYISYSSTLTNKLIAFTQKLQLTSDKLIDIEYSNSNSILDGLESLVKVSNLV